MLNYILASLTSPIILSIPHPVDERVKIVAFVKILITNITWPYFFIILMKESTENLKIFDK